jgi:hypothetical protein
MVVGVSTREMASRRCAGNHGFHRGVLCAANAEQLIKEGQRLSVTGALNP